MRRENPNEAMTYDSVRIYYDSALNALASGRAQTASTKLTHAILELDSLYLQEKDPYEATRLKQMSDDLARFQRSIERNFQNKNKLQEIMDELFKDSPKPLF